MKVVLVRGNPRKNGFTQFLTDLFAQGVRETGASLQDIDLPSLDIKPCLGCFHCWVVEPGTCVHHDPVKSLFPAVLEADVLVCATPMYFFSMSSYLKVFIERLFPLSTQGIVTSKLGVDRNLLREPAKWSNKKFISIVTGALRDPEVYEPINRTFALIADTMDMELGGQLTRSESHLLPYKLSKPMTLKRIETAFLKAGREAGTTGVLSAATMADAALPLSTSAEHFRTYSNIFWDRAIEVGARNTNTKSLQQLVGSDPDILMREMARCVDPKATARLQAVLQFDMPDRRRNYRLTIDRGRCELAFEPAAQPDLRVTCNADIWVALFMRQLDVPTALRQRLIVLDGDKSLFSRLDRYFPPPSV